VNESYRPGTAEHDRSADPVGVFTRVPPRVRIYDMGGVIGEIARGIYAYAEAFVRMFVSPYLAPILAFATSLIRAAYHNKKPWKTRILEGALLALATVAINPVLLHLGMSSDMAVFCGVFMGFVGVDTLSAWIKRYMEGKVK
jgi:lambda family phage holin